MPLVMHINLKLNFKIRINFFTSRQFFSIYYIPTHLLLTQPLLFGHPESLLHPTTQVKLSQTSPLRQSSSRRHKGLHTPVNRSHRSLFKHPVSEEQTGLHAFSIQVVPGWQALFSVQGSNGALTQATLAVGFGTKPVPHEQLAR